MSTTYDEQASTNGHMPPLAAPAAPAAGTGEPRIPFGERDNQSMPASWASDMLTRLNERHGAIFRDLLYHAATGNELAETTRKRSR